MESIYIAVLVVMLIWLAVIYYKLRRIGKGLKDLADQLGKYKEGK